MDLRTRRKRKLLFLEKVGAAGPWTSGGTETEDSPLGPPPGEGAALFSPSPKKEQIPTSPGCPRQGRFIDFLDDLGHGWDAGGAHGDGQTEGWPRGQRWMVHHAGAGVLDRLGLLLYRRELLGKALNGVAK